jgi:NAD(P)H-dependent FMN reductase
VLQAALQAVAAPETRLVVFATPTYKAAYTGLLKCFLDLLAPDALAGKLAVPLMLGAGEGHRLTVEHTLKPVLTELGLAEPQQLELDRFVERLKGMWTW